MFEFFMRDFPNTYYTRHIWRSILPSFIMYSCFYILHSHNYRFHIIGLLVLFVQDIGDILLELSKTVVLQGLGRQGTQGTRNGGQPLLRYIYHTIVSPYNVL